MSSLHFRDTLEYSNFHYKATQSALYQTQKSLRQHTVETEGHSERDKAEFLKSKTTKPVKTSAPLPTLHPESE